jgi:hypothetical protein
MTDRKKRREEEQIIVFQRYIQNKFTITVQRTSSRLALLACSAEVVLKCCRDFISQCQKYWTISTEIETARYSILSPNTGFK